MYNHVLRPAIKPSRSRPAPLNENNMNQTKFNFDAWWTGIVAEWSRLREGYELIDKARQRVKQAAFEDKDTLLDGLMGVIKKKTEGDVLALRIIVGNARTRDLEVIEKMAVERSNYSDLDQESNLTYFLRILAKGDMRFHAPLDQYLSKRPLPTYYSTVQWAFWPEHPDKFADTYSHYLSETPIERWRGTAIVQAFMNHPDAIIFLKRKSRKMPWWQAFTKNLQEQTKSGIWSDQQCKSVTKSLE